MKVLNIVHFQTKRVFFGVFHTTVMDSHINILNSANNKITYGLMCSIFIKKKIEEK